MRKQYAAGCLSDASRGMPKKVLLFAPAMLIFLSAAGGREPEGIWIEGQNPTVENVTRHGWYDRVQRDQLSQNDWISHYHPDKAGEVAYDVEVPRRGEYTFWLRANPSNTRTFYRLNEGQWKRVDMSNPIERINIAGDGALDHRFIAWIKVGAMELPKGHHQLEFRFDGGIANSGGIDCFLLIADPDYRPRGTLKPGEKDGEAEPGHFAWTPEWWKPDRESIFDLSRLNEKTAGQDGFVRRAGEDFVLGSGTPVRFWAVQADVLQGMPKDRLQWWAKRLSAYGVNLVRSGGTSLFEDWMVDRRQAFEKRLDEYHAMVAALKAEGIYVYINHLFWHTNTTVTLPEDVFPGFEDGQKAISLLFFSEDFRKYYLRFLEEVMTAPNPYTGLPMADDPAVAFLEIHNESNLLFYTFNPANLVESERKLVERKFGGWLKRKYGSLEAAVDDWGPKNYPHTIDMYEELGKDQPKAGRMRLYGAHHLTNKEWARTQRNPKRAGDQLQFMVEAQKDLYETMSTLLREKVGVKQLIAPSNWKTADERHLGALEHYTYSGADLIARNSYFGTPHEKNPRFYRIDVGDQYRNRSALKMPGGVSSLQNQTYRGYPYMITENCWNRPNRFRAEFPFLVAAYASLADLNNWLFFAIDSDPWSSDMSVWSINDTTVLGQFPATALMFRRGDVQAGETVVHEELALADLYAFKGQAMRAADTVDDPLYGKKIEEVKKGERAPSRIDPLAFYVGRVTRRVGDGGQGDILADLRPYIDRENKTVKSMTGEIRWDYGAGVVTVNTPRAQGATGFLNKAGRIELDDVVIESDNEYSSILVVSLDDKPLSSSESILIQAGTEDKPSGFRTWQNNGLHTVKKRGGYPLNVRNVDAAVTLKRKDLKDATALDANGGATNRKPHVEIGDVMTIKLIKNALYTWVQ